MAASRLCSIPDCGKPHKGHGFCGTHLLRFRKYGDPNYVVPVSERDYSHNRRPRKVKVDPDWLRREYHEKQRPVGEIAASLGCCVEHLNLLVSKFGIPRRDGRSGAVHIARRAKFDLSQAAWLYEIERMNCNDIGAELGVNGCTVRRRLREAGIRIRQHNETKRGAKARNRIDLNERRIIREYLKPYASMAGVAGRFGVSSNVVARVLNENDIPRKPLDQLRDFPVGENHPSWRSDLSPEERAMRRDGNRQNEWRLKVYERDDFTCVACGDSRGGNLNAHHIVAHCESKELRWKVSNGATLCSTCHRAFHSRFGMRGFGRAELDIFIAERSAEIAA